MPIQFTCTQCSKTIQAPDGSEGKKARCPSCSYVMTIPSLAVAAEVPVAQVATPAPAQAPPPASDNPFAAPTTTDFSGAAGRRSRSARYMPTWENEPSFGNFFKSTKEILLAPKETFRDLKREGSLGRALTFAAISAALMGAIVGFTQAILVAFSQGDIAFAIGMLFGFVLAAAIIYPIMAVIGCFIGGGILHVMLSIAGAKKYDYNATVRSIAYMQMSSWPFMIVPIIGPMIGGIWILVVQIVGLAEVHETTKGRVVLAIFLPFIILATLGLVLGLLLPLFG